MPNWHLAKPIRFVHAADLHLDSPFKGLSGVPPEVAAFLHKATFEAFDNIVQLCLTERVDFLLVAGDIFNAAERSLRAQFHFRDGLARLSEAGISSLVVHGNHDPLDGWSSSIEHAEHVHTFGPNVSREDLDGVQVYGVSYPTRVEQRNLTRDFPPRPRRPETRPFRIGLMHCNVGDNPHHVNYAPCQESDLAAADIDYWALGHVHERRVFGSDPIAVYPGNSQACSFREPGPRGCYLVEVQPKGSVTPTFHDISAVRWQSVDVSIQGLSTMEAFQKTVHDALQRLGQQVKRAVVARVAVHGGSNLYKELMKDPAELLNHLRAVQWRRSPSIWIDRLDWRCLPEVDLVQLGERQDLIGTILRLADDYEASIETALSPTLDAVWNDPRFRPHLEHLTKEELQQLLIDARLLCVEQLGGLS